MHSTLEAAARERARLAVEYGVDLSAARGGWLADREALEVGGWWFGLVCRERWLMGG